MKRFFSGILQRLNRKAKGDFVRRHRYSLAFENLSSRAPVFQIRGSRAAMICLAFVVFAIAGIVWVMAFQFTPLRNLLPTKLHTELRDRYIDMSVRLDSIQDIAALNDRYFRNIANILSDEPVYEHVPDTLIGGLPLDSLMAASEAEKHFVKSFEDAERFNLSVLSPIAADGMTFYSPVPTNTQHTETTVDGIPAELISSTATVPVSAVYRGTVIATHYTPDGGISIEIQHPNDFITVYSGLSQSFVRRGDKVNTGTRLGVCEGGRYPIHFELWHNGTALAPSEYIPF